MKSKMLVGAKGFERLADIIQMNESERQLRREALTRSYMPFQCTEYYADLIAEQDEPWRTQLINIILPPVIKGSYRGRFDPYGNVNYGQEGQQYVQHKYKNTMLLHFVDVCIANCQFCYKVNEIRVENSNTGKILLKIQAALQHLDQHPEVNNVLFTGGDPAAVHSELLVETLRQLLNHPNVRMVRFATKGIAYDPERFMAPELLQFFEEVDRWEGKQITMINQINHPAEFSKTAGRVLKELRKRGVRMRGQPAVVKGVNDEVDTLIELQRRFLDHDVVSYYLTTFMPVRGVEQYGITLDEVFRRVSESKRSLNGLEKKGVLLASHDFGKFEIVGFLPSAQRPEKIILKWHQAAMPQYLPESLRALIPTEPEDVLLLDYCPDTTFCIDHVFRDNGLPYYDSENKFHAPLVAVREPVAASV